MSAMPQEQDRSAELEQICRDAESLEDAVDEARRRKPEENPAAVELQVFAIRQRQSSERRAAIEAARNAMPLDKVLFRMPAIIDRHVEALMAETTADADFTEASLAELFARWNALVLRRCRQTGRWLVNTGKRWQEDAGDMVRDLADHFCTIAGNAALMLYEGKAGAAMQKTIGKAAFRPALLSIVASKQELQVDVQDLDADDWLLNTPDGSVDLKSGIMRPHNPSDLCTKMTAVAPIALEDFPYAFEHSRFCRFLDEVFDRDDDTEREDLINFIQQSVGYCLTGDNKLHFMQAWLGEGRNGKNTLGDLVSHVMGDYAKKISNRVLMQKKHDAHPTEIADLRGVRLAVSSEVSVSDYFNEALLKELTGDDTLSARFMRQDFFTFRRTHKHVVYGNSKPRIRVTDVAIAARMKMIPFERNFLAEGIQDESLPAVLREESPIVLRWLIEGVRKLHEAGLKLPRCAAIERLTADYIDENDVVKLWVSERCLPDSSGTTIKTLSLYDDFKAWRVRRGEQPDSIQKWKPALLRIPGIRGTVSQGRSKIVGIKLDPDRDDF